MYQHILVTLDATPTDRAILDHIQALARALHSRVSLLHVATGVPAKIHGTNADDLEVREDRAYLERIRAEFVALGIDCEPVLAFGDPVKEIVHWVKGHSPDLIAMSTHGHQFVADLLLGTVAFKVQHSVSVPVLLLRAR
ncbi:MAG: universal stress protein [Verrucomicrobiales bacterium]|nr:universal stress protein [Verrucomicrobiales bacterium]